MYGHNTILPDDLCTNFAARKGVNQAADWVKNKTGMGEDGSKSSASCTEGKSVKGN
jgi:hypothetical protein